MGLLDKAEKKVSAKKVKSSPKKRKKHAKKKVKKKSQVQKPRSAQPKKAVRKKKLPRKQPKVMEEDNGLGIDMEAIRSEVSGELSGKRASKPKTPSSKGRISTGIPGLDEVMDGGFRERTVNLVAGGPGSGKSIFTMQFLVNGIDGSDEPGVYVSFEQTEQELLDDMRSFGWDLDEKVKNKKLVIMSYTPEQVEKVLSTGGGTIRDTIESIDAKRVVIDSLTAFTLLHESELAKRKACFTLFEAIRKWGCTALLIEERVHDPDSSDDVTVEDFEVDGVLVLYNIRRSDVRERALEIFKMRATRHSNKIFPMTINEEGVNIYPEETIF